MKWTKIYYNSSPEERNELSKIMRERIDLQYSKSYIIKRKFMKFIRTPRARMLVLSVLLACMPDMLHSTTALADWKKVIGYMLLIGISVTMLILLIKNAFQIISTHSQSPNREITE